MAEKLMAEHVDDGHGRCRGCPVGSQQGYHSWPCTLLHYARQANAVRAAAARDQ